MKKKLLCLTLAALFTLPALLACSKDQADKLSETGDALKKLSDKVAEPEKAIKEMTDKVADQAVEKIRTPLDKAREMANKGDEHLKKIGEELEKEK